MATVKLYFEPYPENDADGLRIEESADGVSGWVEIEALTTQIGTYPNYISSYVTSNATDVDYWFRIRWTVGGVPQNYSEAVQVGELAPKYTTPDLIRETTRSAALVALGTVFMQELIEQAYWMVQGECGPFLETDPDFVEVAPMAMRLYVEYLFVVQAPENLAALSGTIQEKIGSYMYRKSEKAIELWQEGAADVPGNVTALLCRFSVEGDTPTEMETTEVFTPTPWYSDTEEDAEKLKVYVEGGAMTNAPNTSDGDWRKDATD